ncbi:sugar ABC transporter substrate-binding protein [bacterium RCC_150]
MKKPMLVIALAAIATVLSGCGTTAVPSAQSSASGGEVPAAVADLVKTAGASQPWQGPETSPLSKKNALVVSIPCSLASGCSRVDDGVHAAGKALGWQVKTIDPAFDPAKMNQAIQQAIDLHADAIVAWTVDPKLVASSVAAARAAGIVVVGGGNGQEDAPVTKDGFQHGVSLHGEIQGQWVAAQACSDLNAKGDVVIISDPSYDILTQRVEATKAYFAKNCPNITVKVEQVSANDVGTVLQNKVSSIVQRTPELRGLITPVDLFTTDVNVALQQLGNDNVKVYSIDGDAPSVENIAKGGRVAASVGSALEWAGWATMDNVNRLLQGKPANSDDHVPNRMVTKSFIPDNFRYRGDLDYTAKYKKLWETGAL